MQGHLDSLRVGRPDPVETGADVGFIASAFVYDNVIRQRGEPIDAADFKRVRFRAKESMVTAWIYLAGAQAAPAWALARNLVPASDM